MRQLKAILAVLSILLVTAFSAVAIEYPVMRVSAQNTTTPGLSVTSPDGIIVTIATDAFSVRQGINAFIAGPIVQGVSGSVTWTLAAGTLPPGMTFNATNGVMSGIPTSVGVWAGIEISVTDAGGRTGGTQPFSIEVVSAPTVSYQNSLLSVSQRATILPTVDNVFGTPRYTLTGTLPIGLSLDKNTGKISGTPLVTGVKTGLVVTVKDSDGSQSASAPFSIEVVLGGSIAVVTPINLTTGIPALITPVASNVTGPLQWSLADGVVLPPGLTLNSSNGQITGTATAAGTYIDLQVKLLDAVHKPAASNLFRIVVGTFSVTYGIDASYGRGEPLFEEPLVQSSMGAIVYELVSGTLPAGVSLNPSNGVISGFPTTKGQYPGVVIRATDMASNVSTTPPMTIVIGGAELTYLDAATTIGAPLSLAPTIVDMVSPTFTVTSGTLPDGLTLNGATGVISGNAVSAGSANLIVTATALNGSTTASNPFTITVTPPSVSVNNPSTRWRVGIPFYMAPQATGLSDPVTWSVTAGAPPFGVAVEESSGAMSGTPYEAGMFADIVLTAVDANAVTVSTPPFDIEIIAPSIVYPNGSSVEVGDAFSRSPVTADIVGEPIYMLVGGTLPDGLTLDPWSGEIYGTPTQAGSYPDLTVQVIDDGGAFESNTFSINVTTAGQAAVSPIGNYVVRSGVAFTSTTPTVSLLASPNWTMATGTLPSGLTLNPLTGVIAGVTTQLGTASGLSLRATAPTSANATSNAFSIQVIPALTASISPLIYDARKGFSFTSNAPVASGSVGAVSWSVANGSLPAGLVISTSSGVISGTPTVNGNFTFRLQATDAHDGASALTQVVTIQVTNALQVTNDGTVYGTHVNTPLTTPALGIVGASGTIQWSLASGALPPWASQNTSTGIISGTPTAVGTATGLVVRATDISDGAFDDTQSFSLVVLGPLSVAGQSTYTARVGQPFYSGVLSSVNVGGAARYSVVGTLPSWASINTSTGAISGTPTAVGTTTGLKFRVRDDYSGDYTTPTTFSIVVNADPAATWSSTIHKARLGAAVNLLASVLNMATPQWSIYDGGIPGTTLPLTSEGRITGTATTLGDHSVTLMATDTSDGSFDLTPAYDYAVRSPLVAGTDSANITVRVGVPYSGGVPTSSGVVGNATWAFGSGSAAALPPGLSVNPSTGAISGTPAQKGTSWAKLALTDDWDALTVQQAQQINFNITAGMTLPGSMGNISVAVNESIVGKGVTPTVLGAVGAVTWTLEAGTLPPGVTLNSANGTLVGVPTQTGLHSVQLRATDSEGASKTTNAFSVTVNPAPGSNFIVITTGRDWVPPTGVTQVRVAVMGGGTGGTIYNDTTAKRGEAPGGSAGEFKVATVTLNGTQSANVSIGEGGGTSYNGNAFGTQSTFRWLITSQGGGGSAGGQYFGSGAGRFPGTGSNGKGVTGYTTVFTKLSGMRGGSGGSPGSMATVGWSGTDRCTGTNGWFSMSGSGGGGGLVIPGYSPNTSAANGGLYSGQPGTPAQAGEGFGAGGGGGSFYRCNYVVGGRGASGVVYIEWD